MAQNPTSLETFARLSSKPGVQATLILSLHDGAIIRSTGFASADETRDSVDSRNESHVPSLKENGLPSTEDAASTPSQPPDCFPEKIARAVFKYVSETAKLTEAVGAGDDVQLLRLRTKKQEIIITPGERYLLVVIQEAPKIT